MAGPIVSVLKYWFAVIKTTVTLWLEAQVFVHAAALAFFTRPAVAQALVVLLALLVIRLRPQGIAGS